ncbi:site-specific DNA-methyltransferase [Achromobacter insolitus]|uniref:site-specific DNA-methyltransferase n=1 Tax=Achromobacter insolitus TaxID=217204 RepID=UPI002FDE03F2
MPILNWIGKDKVLAHHHEVPYRVLQLEEQVRAPDGAPKNSTDNRIIHGDNLAALKSLLPEFDGQVNCIFIDPPYNTGAEGWVYNDNVSDPKLLKWLGEVVGKEGEDLSRHDKWLCMMYPRLKLLHRLLAKDGVFFVSIDDVEHAHLRLVLDEIFGRGNFLANFVWQSKDTPGNNSSGVAETHNHIIAYRKGPDFKPKLLARNDKQLANYSNPDGDGRGDWLAAPITRAEHRDRDYYPIKNKVGVEVWPPKGSSWRRPPAEMKRLQEEDRIWWGVNGDSTFPSEKKFLGEVKDGVVNQTWWPYQFAGSTRQASAEMKAIFGGVKLFDTPKPLTLLKRILEMATGPNSIVLDSYAGSGTTAHAVLELNAADNGNRRFILVETMGYAKEITAERVKRVVLGAEAEVAARKPLGGGFDYFTIGDTIFTAEGELNDAVGIEAIRSYMMYTEGIPVEHRTPIDNPFSRHLLGLSPDMAWLFNYEPDQATCLNMEYLATLDFGAKKPTSAIIYADRCLLSREFLQAHGIIFKKIPRDVTRF